MKYKHFSELKERMRLVVCTHNKLPKNDYIEGYIDTLEKYLEV